MKTARGYTLIEVMIVIAVFGIIIAGFYKLNTENVLIRKNNAFKQKAVWALQSQTAALRGVPFNFLDDEKGREVVMDVNMQSGLRDAVSDISIHSASPSLKKITLRLAWTDARQNRQELSTSIYRYKK